MRGGGGRRDAAQRRAPGAGARRAAPARVSHRAARHCAGGGRGGRPAARQAAAERLTAGAARMRREHGALARRRVGRGPTCCRAATTCCCTSGGARLRAWLPLEPRRPRNKLLGQRKPQRYSSLPALQAQIARCCGQGSVRVPWPRSPRQHTHAMRCSGHRSEPCSALRVLRVDCNAACGRKLTCDAASAAQAPRLWRGPGGHR